MNRYTPVWQPLNPKLGIQKFEEVIRIVSLQNRQSGPEVMLIKGGKTPAYIYGVRLNEEMAGWTVINYLGNVLGINYFHVKPEEIDHG